MLTVDSTTTDVIAWCMRTGSAVHLSVACGFTIPAQHRALLEIVEPRLFHTICINSSLQKPPLEGFGIRSLLLGWVACYQVGTTRWCYVHQQCADVMRVQVYQILEPQSSVDMGCMGCMGWAQVTEAIDAPKIGWSQCRFRFNTCCGLLWTLNSSDGLIHKIHHFWCGLKNCPGDSKVASPAPNADIRR